MDDFKSLLWGSAVAKTPQPITQEYKVDRLYIPQCIYDRIDPLLKSYLDFFEQRYVPVIGYGAVDMVSGGTFTRYLNIRAADSADIADSLLTAPLPALKFQDYYITAIPKHLQTIFTLHDIKFVPVDHGGRRLYIYEKTLDETSNRLGVGSSNTGTNALATPVTITLNSNVILLQDFYLAGDAWESIRVYLKLLGVKFVTVPHNGYVYNIPTCYLDVVARRHGLCV